MPVGAPTQSFAAGRRWPLRLNPETSSAASHKRPFSPFSCQSRMYVSSFHHSESRDASHSRRYFSAFHQHWLRYHSSRSASSESGHVCGPLPRPRGSTACPLRPLRSQSRRKSSCFHHSGILGVVGVVEDRLGREAVKSTVDVGEIGLLEAGQCCQSSHHWRWRRSLSAAACAAASSRRFLRISMLCLRSSSLVVCCCLNFSMSSMFFFSSSL